MGMIVTDTSEVAARLGVTEPNVTQAALIESAINGAEGAVKQHLRYDPVYRERTEYYMLSDLNRGSRSGSWDVDANNAFFRLDSYGVSNELQIRHLPIRAISSLRINSEGRNGTGTFGVDDEKTEGTDFWANYNGLDSSGNKICYDGIIRSIGLWGYGPGSIRIVYTAGYTAAELAGEDTMVDGSLIYESVIEEAARRTKGAFLEAQTVGGSSSTTSTIFVAGLIQSERLGDYSYHMGNSIGMRGSTSDRLYGGVSGLLPSTKEKLSGHVNYAFID